MILTRRIGFEVELMAPPGRSRRTLGDDLAVRSGGHVRRVFHLDSEPSPVPGVEVFHHLTPGFEVFGAEGAPRALLVDDITITCAGAAGSTVPGPEWYRILCDDARLLRLVALHADPEASAQKVLDPVATLFRVPVQVLPQALRVDDAAGATVAVAVPLPPGRERVCEIVTPPLAAHHLQVLEGLLGPARELGFTVPAEAAVHLHVDGAPFRNPAAFANLVRLFGHWRSALWTVLGTNPACQRLGPLPEALLAMVDVDGGRPADGWAALQAAARATGVGKYHDVNVGGLLTDTPVRDTVEIRILPGSIDGAEIVRKAALVEALLDLCLEDRPVPLPGSSDPGTAARELLTLAGALR